MQHTDTQIRTRTESKRYTATEPLAVVGLGYVGLPLALLAEEKGHEVLGFDIDAQKVRNLQNGVAAHLSENEQLLLGTTNCRFSDDERALENAGAYLVCVPTPVDEAHEPDLAPLIAASEIVGRHLSPGTLVVIESTVNPGVCEGVVLPILERASGLRVELDFYFAHCPERINPGDAVWVTRTIPRVVGAVGPESLEQALALYGSILDSALEPMQTLKEAEAVKMVENAFRDVNIAFVNELAMSFAKAGIDLTNVLRGAGTKPFSFMPHQPGCGVGGHCIPVDPYYLIQYGRENGFEHRFLASARAINNAMPAYTVDLLEAALESEHIKLEGATVALLGLAYKRDIADLRESPALAIRQALESRGARVQAYDPYAPAASSVQSVDDALARADGVILATDHTAFRSLTPERLVRAGVRIIVDGRNCLPKDAFLAEGLVYRGIGR
jgi:nucleotide sugar dehydrogenase